MSRRSIDRLGLRASFGVLALSASIAACSDLTRLKQEAPSLIEIGKLEGPESAALLLNSMIGDFECAFAQEVVATGLLSDELANSNTDGQSKDYDRRSIFPTYGAYASAGCASLVPGLYRPLQTALFDADNLARKLQGWTDAQVTNRVSALATAQAYGGYALTMLAEVFCTGAINGSIELTSAQMLDSADARFSAAITNAQAANNTNILNLARLGRARVRLDRGKFAEAAADAALIPANFVFNATYSTVNARRENSVNSQTYRDLRSTVEAASRNITFNGAPDPRATVVAGTNAAGAPINGQDQITPNFRPTKYPTLDTPIPIAKYSEAQLILAEAKLQAGDVQGAVDIINALHTKAGIAQYGGGTAAEVKTQLIAERRAELFLEGHRYGDVLRYGITLPPAPGTPYPTGAVYGSVACLPLPEVERNNNPNIRTP